MRLQSVQLRVPDVAKATRFFEDVWGLVPGSNLIGLEQGEPGVRSITFSGTAAEIGREREMKGPDGETYRFVVEQSGNAPPVHPDKPIELSHVVLNASDADASERFATGTLGFKVSDRTRHMTFVRCSRVHHCVAYARAGYGSLNHIAFKMADLDAVMRGIGRLRDAGYPAVWGPGRHGPGNNVFGYFIGPHGGIVEYTAEVEEVENDYKVGSPEDWKWPPGRVDHWGVSQKDNERIGAAERVYRFI